MRSKACAFAVLQWKRLQGRWSGSRLDDGMRTFRENRQNLAEERPSLKGINLQQPFDVMETGLSVYKRKKLFSAKSKINRI